MAESRTKLAIKSMGAGILSKILALGLSFASRTLFIYYLGTEYLGINGLYSNILSVLSFAELGFGTAMTFALYKPVAQNDDVLTVQLLDYFRHVYRWIALIVTIVGLVIIPLFPYIIKGADNIAQKDLIIYYLLFLANSVISYFIVYKTTYVNALQKTYIVTNIETILNLVTVVMQIIVIVLFKNFLIYLVTQTSLLILSRLFIALYLNKKFPIVKYKPNQKLSKDNKSVILTNVKGLVISQFSSVVVHSTDNIIISSTISIIVVGLVSNYNLIISSVTAFLIIIFSNFAAPLGNIYAVETKETFYNWYRRIDFLNFWLYGFCTVAFFVLIPPFITLWIGADKLIDNISFILIIINTYIIGQMSSFGTARNAVGQYNIDKWWSLGQAVVNIVVSVPCAIKLGLVGVYIGTITSRMIYFLRPISTFNLMFEKSVIIYYLKFFFHFLVVLISCVATYFAIQPILELGGWGWFFVACVVVVILPNVIFLLCTFWTNDFKLDFDFLKERINNILHRVKKNNTNLQTKDICNNDVNKEETESQDIDND